MRSTKVPRASLSIGLLRDQDFISLWRSPEGREAFGVFAVLVLAARERLAEGRATRLEGTFSIRFEDKPVNLESITGIKLVHLEFMLKQLEIVASENGGMPWVYRDEHGRVVIRSFFKYNASESWGGARTRVQDELKLNSSCNQVEQSPTPTPTPTPTPNKSPYSPPSAGGRVKKSRASDKPEDPEAFGRFWEVWPRRRRADKPAAVRAWNRALGKTDAASLVSAAIEYAASDQGRGEFVRMPATWLNAEGWTDDRETWRAAPPTKRPSLFAEPPKVPPLERPSQMTDEHRARLRALEKSIVPKPVSQPPGAAS